MKTFFQHLANQVQLHNSISPDMFQKYNVKRGLRNEDGTGVLVGLTEVSSVIGYTINDEEVIPCPGQLFYRGIDINEIIAAAKADDRYAFEETIYLLLGGKLPDQTELDDFKKLLAKNRKLPRNFVRDQLSTFRTPNVMNALATSVLTMYGFDDNPESAELENLLRQSVELIAKVPCIVAYAYRVYLETYSKKSLIIHRSNSSYGIAQDFLHLIRDNGKFTEIEAKVLDAALVLHADHGGGNNSTFATRVVTSSGTDTYSAVAAGLGSLKGPMHGGANMFVSKMMADLKKNVKDWTSEKQIRTYLLKLLKGEAGDRSGKLYGFGHAVYTISDPRTLILKEYAHLLAEEKGRKTELDLYLLVEELAPKIFAEYKGSKKAICSNVDFYSGFVYSCMDIPEEVFTPLFAMSRVVGWLVHRMEEILVQKRIIRPAYKNVTAKVPYIPIQERTSSRTQEGYEK